jgi:hypothetical protein
VKKYIAISFLIFCSFAWLKDSAQVANTLDGKLFNVKIIRVENADIVTSGKIMSQFAEIAKPDSSEKTKDPVFRTYLDFENGRFYSPLLTNNADTPTNSKYPQQLGCLYKISTKAKDVIQFDAICMVYASLFQNPKSDTLVTDKESPDNKPVATWGGTVKNDFIEGTISWDGMDGKRRYYYYNGYLNKK